MKTANKISVYNLQEDETEDSNTRITPEHPNYEDMIVEVLENQVSKNGMSQELLLRRIKQNWKVKTRYAQPAIRNALKELRKKQRVKRSTEGLYRKVTKRLNSSRPKSAKLKPKTTRPKSANFARISKNTSSKLENTGKNKSSSKSSPKSRPKSNQKSKSFSKSTSSKNHSTNQNMIRQLDNISNSTHLSNGRQAVFERPRGSNHLKNQKPASESDFQTSDSESSSSEFLQNVGYKMDKNWPLYAETTRLDLAQMKNRLRSILLENREEPMTESELLCQTVLEISHERGVKVSAKMQREIAPDVERALLHMVSTGETKKCSQNKYSMSLKNDLVVLNGKNMVKFLGSLGKLGSSNSDTLLQAVRKFKNYTFEEVSEVFESAVNCVQEPTDFSCCEEDDEEVVSMRGSRRGGNRNLGANDDETRNGNGNLDTDMTTEQLRLECPCCNNELLITVKYSK
jgi:uncharacterized protein (DUF2132 family)